MTRIDRLREQNWGEAALREPKRRRNKPMEDDNDGNRSGIGGRMGARVGDGEK